jgi:hypothetical protein
VTDVALSHVVSAPATESPRQYFRRFLSENARRASELGWYFDQAIPRVGENDEVRLAVEELVDQVGRFLEFDVTRDEECRHAVWASKTGHQLLVWTVDTATALAEMGQATRARDERLASEHVTAWTDVSCLLVVCGRVNHRLLGDATVLRRVGDRVRLSTVDGIRALAGLHERGLVAHDAVLSVLRPASAFADPLVALIDRHAGRAAPSGHADTAEQAEDRR